MAKDIWFFSDHHYGHYNILNFKDKAGNLTRPGFSNVDEMDEYMIEMWNQYVKPGDKVWHGGDITFDKKKFVDKILNKLHGKIRMTLGNHDDLKWLARLGRFEKLVESRRFDEFDFIFKHQLLHPESLWNHRKQKHIAQVCGHIHHNDPPEGAYINVCVEKTNYKPIHIEDLKVMVREKLS